MSRTDKNRLTLIATAAVKKPQDEEFVVRPLGVQSTDFSRLVEIGHQNNRRLKSVL